MLAGVGSAEKGKNQNFLSVTSSTFILLYRLLLYTILIIFHLIHDIMYHGTTIRGRKRQLFLDPSNFIPRALDTQLQPQSHPLTYHSLSILQKPPRIRSKMLLRSSLHVMMLVCSSFHKTYVFTIVLRFQCEYHSLKFIFIE